METSKRVCTDNHRLHCKCLEKPKHWNNGLQLSFASTILAIEVKEIMKSWSTGDVTCLNRAEETQSLLCSLESLNQYQGAVLVKTMTHRVSYFSAIIHPCDKLLTLYICMTD